MDLAVRTRSRRWVGAAATAALLAATLLAGVATAPGAAASSVLLVTTTLDDNLAGPGELTLRAAITQANTAGGDHTIVLQSGATYALTHGCGEGSGSNNENANVGGDLDYTSSATLELTVDDVDRATITAEGCEGQRVFDNRATGHLVLQSLVIEGGGPGYGGGGGIRSDSGDVTVRHSILRGNVAADLAGECFLEPPGGHSTNFCPGPGGAGGGAI